MTPQMHTIEFEGGVLRRGFWLYVCEIRSPEGEQLLYVGRTGDNSTPNAQSPFVRMGQNLGKMPNSSMVRNHLEKRGVVAEDCSFKFVSFGPVIDEAPNKDMEEHKPRRDKAGALEKALADDLTDAGYTVLNPVNCSWELDAGLYEGVQRAFAEAFPRMESPG